MIADVGLLWQHPAVVKVGERLGRYTLQRRIALGGYAQVLEALDRQSGQRVALKVPYPHLLEEGVLDEIRREVELTRRLDHPHILPVLQAEMIEGLFVISYPLGDGTLGDRLKRKLPLPVAIEFLRQMVSAVAHAHRQGVIHCDLKPENFILFEKDTLRLTDFGIAKAIATTIHASGSGTVGYSAPEQAMGRPSPRSDVFSLGLILCEMLTGDLPEWPFLWPPPGLLEVRRQLHPDLLWLLRTSLCVDERLRFDDADQLELVVRGVEQRALALYKRRRHKRR